MAWFEAHADLAVPHLAQGARVLAGHPDRVLPLLGKTRVIQYPRGPPARLPRHPCRQFATHRHPVPRTLVHELLHRLLIAAIPLGHPGRRFSPPPEQQARDVESPPSAALRAPQQRQQRFHERLQPTPYLAQSLCVHAFILTGPARKCKAPNGVVLGACVTKVQGFGLWP